MFFRCENLFKIHGEQVGFFDPLVFVPFEPTWLLGVKMDHSEPLIRRGGLLQTVDARLPKSRKTSEVSKKRGEKLCGMMKNNGVLMNCG